MSLYIKTFENFNDDLSGIKQFISEADNDLEVIGYEINNHKENFFKELEAVSSYANNALIATKYVDIFKDVIDTLETIQSNNNAYINELPEDNDDEYDLQNIDRVCNTLIKKVNDIVISLNIIYKSLMEADEALSIIRRS